MSLEFLRLLAILGTARGSDFTAVELKTDPPVGRVGAAVEGHGGFLGFKFRGPEQVRDIMPLDKAQVPMY